MTQFKRLAIAGLMALSILAGPMMTLTDVEAASNEAKPFITTDTQCCDISFPDSNSECSS